MNLTRWGERLRAQFPERFTDQRALWIIVWCVAFLFL